MPSPRLLAVLLLAAVAVAGCGRDDACDGSRAPGAGGAAARGAGEPRHPRAGDEEHDAHPGRQRDRPRRGRRTGGLSRPRAPADAVTLVDTSDWRVAIAASALMAPPFNAPLLFTDGTDLPGPSASALDALAPKGADAAGKAQVIRIGSVAKPPGLKSSDIIGNTPFGADARDRGADPVGEARQERARADRQRRRRRRSRRPRPNYAAKSGDPVLFVTKDTVPPETRAALAALGRADAAAAVHARPVVRDLADGLARSCARLGRVQRYGGAEPVANAIAAARYKDGAFGWGVVDPGHGLVFARAGRPLDAAASSALSGSGKYGPLLLLDDPPSLPQPLAQYLLDIQPGYNTDPVSGVYNHGWIIGEPTRSRPRSRLASTRCWRSSPSARPTPRRRLTHEPSRASRPPARRPSGHARRRPPADGRVDAALRAAAAQPHRQAHPRRCPPSTRRASRASARSRA